MTTIRRRLTGWYSVALIATLFAFGVALYYEFRKHSLPDLDQRMTFEADLASKYLEESYRVLGSLVADSPRPTLDPGVSAYFEGFRDHFILTDPRGQVLVMSEPVRQLPFETLERLSDKLRPLPPAVRNGTITLGTGHAPLRYMVKPVSTAGPEIGALLVATPIENAKFEPAALVRSMIVVAPLVIGCSLLLGYWLAGRTLQPVQVIMDEMDAIADGTSLHRRLAVPMSADEMARLALTVNRMLARLEQSFANLRRFTADASHELKTPLMVLRAGVERGLTHPRTPREVMESLDETLQQINEMSEMVDSLLTLARADEGRAPLAVEPCDLRELLEEASETAGMLAEASNLTITTGIPDRPVVLEVDRHRIRELLLNLVTNAIKYTPPGGTVELALRSEEHHAAIVVRDTGIGIAPGDLPNIFERFWRADPARSRSGERPGTGLGLAITKWIAEAHGGSIAVQSRPGRGTIFTVLLPKPPEIPQNVTPATDVGARS